INNEKPAVTPDSTLKKVIVEISKNRLGATAVVNDKDELVGMITDGDLRRMLEKNGSLDTVGASDIMSTQPKTILPEALAVNALDLLRKNDITQLVVASEGRYLGI